MLWSTELLFIGITGTRPVMTVEEVVTSEGPRAGDVRAGTV
jgi:hypothetical protein